MIKLHAKINELCAIIIAPIANLAARIYIGWFVFFSSGLTKFADMEETIELFDIEEDGEYALSFLPAEPAAYLATAGELILPVLLMLGLLTRFSAAGLFVMSLVIQIFVFDLDTHYYWMLILGMLIGTGGGKLSLDYWLLNLKK